MDSFLNSLPLGRRMESSSDDDTNDFRGRTFPGDELDSEEEEQRQMEELLYCQLYFDPDNKISSEAKVNEYNYETVEIHGSKMEDDNPGLSESIMLSKEESDTSVKLLSKSISTFIKEQRQNENRISVEVDAKHASKSDDKIHKTLSEDFRNEKISSSVSNDGRKHLTVGSKSSLEAETIDSSSEIFIDSDSEEPNVPSMTKRRKKAKGKESKDKLRREEVFSISDESSNSSIFIDVSSEDDDMDIHMNAGLMANDEYLQKIHDSLPDCDWSICHVDEFGPPKKSRYYDSASKVQCQNCSQRGHLTRECPQPKKAKACLLCGERGHLSRFCKQSLCFRCNKPGHLVKFCDRKRNSREDYCYRCGVYGHLKRECPDVWRQFHLTTMSSDMVTGAKLENHRKFCFNCAGSGHFGYECRKEKSDQYVPTILPFIAKYEKSKMNSQKQFCNASDPELSYKKRSGKKFKSYESENQPKSHRCESSATKAEKRHYVKPHSESFDVLDSGKPKKRDKFAGDVESPCAKRKKMKAQSAISLEAETLVGTKPDQSGFHSHNLSSFAQNVKEKMLRKKSTPSKPKTKKTRKTKDLLQRSFIPFDETSTKELSNSSQNFFGTNRPQKTVDIVDRMLSLSGTSLDKKGREEHHNSGEGAFPNMRISLSLENLNESSGKHSDSKLNSRPLRRVAIGDTFIGDNLMHHSTPNERSFNGNWKDEKLSPIEMLRLNEDEMEREYYGRKLLRKAKRKERRKATKAKFKALVEASSTKKRNVRGKFGKKNSLPPKEEFL